MWLAFQVQGSTPGECIEYRSLDSVLDESQAVHFPIKFLNSQEVSGFPSHLLSFKVSAPVIILRSLDPPIVTEIIFHLPSHLCLVFQQ